MDLWVLLMSVTSCGQCDKLFFSVINVVGLSVPIFYKLVQYLWLRFEHTWVEHLIIPPQKVYSTQQGSYSQHFFIFYDWVQKARVLRHVRLEGFVRDKHSRLLDPFVSCDENEFWCIWQQILDNPEINCSISLSQCQWRIKKFSKIDIWDLHYETFYGRN